MLELIIKTDVDRMETKGEYEKQISNFLQRSCFKIQYIVDQSCFIKIVFVLSGFGAKHAFLRHIQHFENMSMQIRILLNSIQEMKCFFYHANIIMNTSARIFGTLFHI